MANCEAYKAQSGSRRRRSVAGGLYGVRAAVMVVVLMMMAIVLHVSAGDADASYKGLNDKEKYGLSDVYKKEIGYDGAAHYDKLKDGEGKRKDGYGQYNEGHAENKDHKKYGQYVDGGGGSVDNTKNNYGHANK